MKIDIKMPKMGESIVEGTIGTIFKQNGAIVQAGEEILEIETDKVNQSIQAPSSGKLQLQVNQGDTVKVDQVIASIDEDAASESSAKTTESPKEEKPLQEQKSPQKKKRFRQSQKSSLKKKNQPQSLLETSRYVKKQMSI